jgi:7-alpha-hydroxysteroid dehydrogenase
MIAQHPNRENGQTIGTIVNLSSIAATHTLPETFSYSVSSAALNQLTRSLSIALADKGIRVNGVALGSVMSSSLRGMIRDDLDLHDKVVQATPLGRIGEADEVASAVLFLASSDANFITGQILTVDGGRTLIDRMESPAY